MQLESLKKLYVHELKDLYSAENQILDILPRLRDAADDEDLKKAFDDHFKETQGQVGRLETIFEGLDFGPHGEHCAGAAGLIAEAKEMINHSDVDPAVRDAGLVAAAQRIEHYEIAGYGCARTYAEALGETKAADLLTKTLDEEASADKALSRLAERRLNFLANVA